MQPGQIPPNALWKGEMFRSIFILAKPACKFLTAELAAVLPKTLREKSNP